MDHCDDVLLLVLLLLPPKASARFKLVSSRWNQLISSSSYLQYLHKCCVDHRRVIGFYHGSKYFEHLKFERLVLDNNNEGEVRYGSVINTAVKKRYEACSICATCEGFFLIDRTFDVTLENPVTNTSRSITQPAHPFKPTSVRLTYYGLATSFSSSSPLGGCGSRENEAYNKLSFEIVTITITKELTSSYGSIYSSSTKRWTPLEFDEFVLQQLNSPQSCVFRRFYSFWDPHPNLNPIGATFLKQSLHWLLDDRRIFAFDLKERSWRHMETPASTERGKQGRLTLIKNYSDIISTAIKNTPREQRTVGKVFKNLVSYLYPDVWFGSVGYHIYLLLVIDETDLQLWILDNYDEVEWKMIVEIRSCGFIAPLLFDGRSIFVAAFDFEEWKNEEGVVRIFDTFTGKWLSTNFIISEDMDKLRFFFPSVRPP